jgi:YfiR/HmsC-like
MRAKHRSGSWPALLLMANAICVAAARVLGTDPLGTNLDEVARGEAVNKHPLVIARYRSVADIGDCQILFIPATEHSHLGEILAALKGRSVLTVTDAKDAAQRGVVIALVTQDNRIRLRIDVEAAKAGNLVISSKLLRPAEIVGQATG